MRSMLPSHDLTDGVLCHLSHANGKFRALIGQALRAWNMQPASYQPEIARTTFLKSKLSMLKREVDVADRLRKEAAALRVKIPGAPEKAVEDLEECDFDKLVTFWSR